VCENRATAWSGSCTGGQRTDYRYDVGSRLTRVCQQPSGGSCGQTREFLYDQRGLLTAERHPEIGATGNGRTFYIYDALGNVLTKDLDGTEKFDLGFAYDPASRLIRVEEPDPYAPGSTRLLKELFYARKNEGNDKRQGKLYQARRRNWVQPVSPLPRSTPPTASSVPSRSRRARAGARAPTATTAPATSTASAPRTSVTTGSAAWCRARCSRGP